MSNLWPHIGKSELNPLISSENKNSKCGICLKKFKKHDKIYILEGAKVEEIENPKEFVYILIPKESKYFHQDCIDGKVIQIDRR